MKKLPLLALLVLTMDVYFEFRLDMLEGITHSKVDIIMLWFVVVAWLAFFLLRVVDIILYLGKKLRIK